MSLTFASDESVERARSSQRRAALSALGVTLVLLAGGVVILLVWTLTGIITQEPTIAPLPLEREAPSQEEQPQITRAQPQPSMAAAATPPIATTTAVSEIAAPEPSTLASQPVVSLGTGAGLLSSGLGQGLSQGVGRSDDSSSAFGSSNGAPGLLEGQLYDIKRNRRGEDQDVTLSQSDVGDYVTPVNETLRVIARGRSVAEVDVFPVGEPRYMNILAIETQSADNGPAAFNAADELEPMGWFVHYSGIIKAPVTGRFRFAGIGDDLLTVQINGRMVLNASWPTIRDNISQPLSWEASPPFDHPSLDNQNLVYGDWISAREGQAMDIELLFGEHPGGLVGAVLLVQWEGASYAAAGDRPLLHPFALVPLTEGEEQRLENFSNFEFELENIPLFGAR